MRVHTRALWRGALGFLVALGLPALAAATSLRSVSMGEMLAGAELVFEGRVLDSSATSSDGEIRTCARFEVLDVVKGPPVASPLTLCFAGGSVDGSVRGVHGLIHPKSGEHGLYFVASLSEERMNPLYGWQQGHFVVGGDGAVSSADGRAVVGLDPAAEAPGAMLSRGVARGMVVRSRGARSADPGLGVDAFKAALRSRLQEGQ